MRLIRWFLNWFRPRGAVPVPETKSTRIVVTACGIAYDPEHPDGEYI